MDEFDFIAQARFISNIKKHCKYKNVIKEFHNIMSLRHMITYMWGLEEFHENIKIEKISSLKDDIYSNKLRNTGNSHFRNMMFDKALESYNACIINAVYLEENICPKSSQSLALGFANRSATLYEMKHYDLCLTDIKRAFQQGYPIELHVKLIIRKMKCHIAENNIHAANETYDQYISDEKYSCNEELLRSLRRMMSDHEMKDTNENSNCQEILNFKAKIVNTNKFFPSASDAIELNFSDKGRGFIAKRDIMPGEVLMIEKGHCTIVVDTCLMTHCNYCLQRIKYAPLPCKNCNIVIFCDEECREAANKAFHMVECPILSAFLKLDMLMSSFQVLRFLCQVDIKQLLEQFRQYEEECLTSNPNAFGHDDTESVYQVEDLRNIFRLVTNKESRSPDDLFKKCTTALTLYKLFLIASTDRKVTEMNAVDITILSKEQITLATLILQLSISFPTNGFNVNENVHTTPGCNNCMNLTIGSGVYPTFSLINHSCNPNMAITSFSRGQMGIAINLIKAGSEICVSYMEGFHMSPLPYRMTKLKKKYYFTCKCKACIEDWPMLDNLSKELHLRCPNCSSPFSHINLKCSKCKKVATKLKVFDGAKYINFNKIIEQRTLFHNKLSALHRKLITSFATENDIKLCLETIAFADCYCLQPSQIPILAQEHLLQALDRCAHFNMKYLFE